MFSDQSAEISLNTPSRCITSIKADRTHHRFLVGTSSASSSSIPPSDNENTQIQQQHGQNNNSLYLLRFHEELNELGIDSILAHPTGQAWNISSCPYDNTLVVTCGGGGGIGGGGAKTKLWRIPKEVVENEDELEYIPDDHHHHVGDGGAGGGGGRSGGNNDSLRQSENVDAIGGGGVMVDRSGGRGRKSHVTMEEVCDLDTRNQNKNNGLGEKKIFQGRLSSILWNPLSSSSSSSSGGGLFDLTSGYMDDEDDNDYNNDDISGGYGANDDAETSATGDVLTLDYTGNVHRWDLKQTSDAKIVQSFSLPTSSSVSTTPSLIPPKMAWDPHDVDSIACSTNTTVKLYDLRTSSITSALPKYAHRYGITDLDYNPNKTYTMVTSGCDGLIKFWDLRYLSDVVDGDDDDDEHETRRKHKKRVKPIKIIRGGHTHYTTTVKYNTFHDQLMVSGGSDSIVNLWRISSVSSAPLLDLGEDDEDEDDEEGMEDGLVDEDGDMFGENEEEQRNEEDENNYGPSLEDEDFGARISRNSTPSKKRKSDKGDNNINRSKDDSAPDVRVLGHVHTDAVYNVTWSAVDAWVFVSLSYDGNVILNHVPSKEKYKILL